jgi:hypothetical protein
MFVANVVSAPAIAMTKRGSTSNLSPLLTKTEPWSASGEDFPRRYISISLGEIKGSPKEVSTTEKSTKPKMAIDMSVRE